MAEGSDRRGAQVTASSDSRVTPVGAFLRQHKLDEFPQLVNVLKGEMSLVGPRPEVPKYVQYYPTEFDRLCTLKPGMTHRVSLLLRNEEKILAVAKDPENLYIKSVLPWKLKLYLDSLGQDGLVQDLKTIWETVSGRGVEVGDLVPRLEGPEMPAVEVFNVEPYPEHIPQRQPVVPVQERPVPMRQFARTGTDLA
jgi:lipopolysaccharide/colanic/teichoic acid biosynthesis glycosyltransferase